jgi:hypothetical protein
MILTTKTLRKVIIASLVTFAIVLGSLKAVPANPIVGAGSISERFDANFYPSDEEAPEGYPLANMFFLLLRKQYASGEMAQRMKDMASWILTKGQTFNEEFKSAKIPETVTQRAIQVANTTIKP